MRLHCCKEEKSRIFLAFYYQRKESNKFSIDEFPCKVLQHRSNNTGALSRRVKPSTHKKTTQQSALLLTPFSVFLPFLLNTLGWFEVLISPLPPGLKRFANKKSFPLDLRLFKTTPALGRSLCSRENEKIGREIPFPTFVFVFGVFFPHSRGMQLLVLHSPAKEH